MLFNTPIQNTPVPTLRANYQPSAFLIDTVDLTFDLNATHTQVTSRLTIYRNEENYAPKSVLVLHGRELELVSITLDGNALSATQYEIQPNGYLQLENLPDRATLEIVTRIHPETNTSLSGLYQSGNNFYTQCEAEGFRKITYYLDRPDVMASFTTTIIADRNQWPVLLSNGNKVGSGTVEGDPNRHWVKWVDPFKKPAYLFALVAGQLHCVADTFTTASGRPVALEIWVAPQDADKCAHAMTSLKKAMRWDEERFGLEYDLDTYMIVAVSDFNMGAMENKGLNIFNTKYVLAKPDTATDADFEAIEAVIAHEYFHNWTGNRITCRDWFQLSLKEGLTVFRDQEFSADMGSAAVKRIEDVRVLRTHQFAEDAGPMAHPVRPDSYIEINNFYTVTVYEKGAEVVRMYQTLFGREGFRRGMDLYFDRYDGQAVTCDDFREAMAEANQTGLTQFARWYSQAGTPTLTVRGKYNPESQIYVLDFTQSCPATPGQSNTKKEPFHIPVRLGLIDAEGEEIPMRLIHERADAILPTSRVLSITETHQYFTFVDIAQEPTPSLLRGFSAPVKLIFPYTRAQLLHLVAHDKDPFCRWEAGQALMMQDLQLFIAAIKKRRAPVLQNDFVEAIRTVLTDSTLDPAFIALMLSLPSETYIADSQADHKLDIHPAPISKARLAMRQGLAQALRNEFEATYHRLEKELGHGEYQFEAKAAARRALKNVVLGYLTAIPAASLIALAQNQFNRANNMTDAQAALACLVDWSEGDAALATFATRWADDALVMDKWFSLQATSQRLGNVAHIKRLMAHDAFTLTNPNKVRALIGAFLHGNLAGFHALDGSGYTFAAEIILALDKINPQIAARLVGVFNRWKKLEPKRREQMKAALDSIANTAGLSNDVHEIVSKNLL